MPLPEPILASHELALRLEVGTTPPGMRPDQCVKFWRDAAARIRDAGHLVIFVEGGGVMAWPAIDGLPVASRLIHDGDTLTVSSPCDCTCDGACDHPSCPRA